MEKPKSRYMVADETGRRGFETVILPGGVRVNLLNRHVHEKALRVASARLAKIVGKNKAPHDFVARTGKGRFASVDAD